MLDGLLGALDATRHVPILQQSGGMAAKSHKCTTIPANRECVPEA